MHVLVVNCGSSSIKSEVIDVTSGRRHGGFLVERIGEEDGAATRLSWRGPWDLGDDPQAIDGASHARVLAVVLPQVLAKLEAAEISLDGVVQAPGGAEQVAQEL